MLFGPSGAGKTLVLDSVAGFTQPDEGRVLLDNEILYDAVESGNGATARTLVLVVSAIALVILTLANRLSPSRL